MVILNNVYLFCSNPKTNRSLGTIGTFLVVTVKMIYMYSFEITVASSLLDKTEKLKQRTRKHKSDVIHPNNSNCKKCSESLRTCSEMKEPYFNIYRFLNEENKYLREFKERRYIMNWDPPLNSYQNPLYTLTQI